VSRISSWSLAFLFLVPQQPDAATLSKGVQQAASRYRSLQYVREVVTEGVDPPTPPSRSQASFVAPDKFRIEMTSAQGVTLAISVSDGTNAWTSYASTKQFGRIAMTNPAVAVVSIIGGLPSIPELPGSTPTVGEDVVTIAGQRQECWVLTRTLRGAEVNGVQVEDVILRSWIDKGLSLPVQQVLTFAPRDAAGGGVRTTVRETTTYKVNEAIPASLFAFAPPTGFTQTPNYALFTGAGITTRTLTEVQRNLRQDVVQEPVLLSMRQPSYSEEARNARIQGNVELEILVQTNGSVEVDHVVTSLGHGLDERAIEAVRQWKFRPGTKNGQAVPTRMTVMMTFSLR
jgi:TonB family protein